MRQLQGLSLARSGAVERANRILADLEREGHADEETLGILGQTHKDLGILAVDRQLANRGFSSDDPLVLAREVTRQLYLGLRP